MKNQALFSSKDKSKKLKCGLLQFLFSALRVKCFQTKLTNSLTVCYSFLLPANQKIKKVKSA